MPESAAAAVSVDHCCRLADIAAILVHYDPPNFGAAPPVPPLMEAEHRLTAMEVFLAEEKQLAELGSPSGLTCPECQSVLYELADARVLRFRCRSGHAISAKTLLYALATSRENALWSAVRSLTEEAALARQMAEREAGRGGRVAAKRLGERAALLIERANGIRQLLGSPTGL
jgi:two-component system chemotaxis response regulator CheB